MEHRLYTLCTVHYLFNLFLTVFAYFRSLVPHSLHTIWTSCALSLMTHDTSFANNCFEHIHALYTFFVYSPTIYIIYIRQIHQQFWLYKEVRVSNWFLFSFYKTTNDFGPTRGSGLRSWIYFHSTNLPTFLALQGGPGLEIEYNFHSTKFYSIIPEFEVCPTIC